MPHSKLARLATLIIDDDDMMRSYLRLMLKEAGLGNIHEAGDAQTARKLVKLQQPALILLDINLPDTDGVEYLEELKQSHPDCHVVMVSSESTLDRVQTSLAKGAQGFIVKPFNADTVLKQIGVIVRNLGAALAT